jgi:hypothetical protein
MIVLSMGSRLRGNDGFEANEIRNVVPAKAGTYTERADD